MSRGLEYISPSLLRIRRTDCFYAAIQCEEKLVLAKLTNSRGQSFFNIPMILVCKWWGLSHQPSTFTGIRPIDFWPRTRQGKARQGLGQLSGWATVGQNELLYWQWPVKMTMTMTLIITHTPTERQTSFVTFIPTLFVVGHNQYHHNH